MKLSSGSKALLAFEFVYFVLVLGILYFVGFLNVLGVVGFIVIWCLFLFAGISLGRGISFLFQQLRKP